MNLRFKLFVCFREEKRVFEPKSGRLGVEFLGDQEYDNADVDVG